MIVVYARFHALGHIVSRRSPDAQSYEWPWELMSASDALQSLRTFGYPLFLRAWGLFAEDYSALAASQLLFYFLAVLLFWRAFASYSDSPWLAFAAVVPLLTSSLLPFFHWVQPDLVAPSMAIVTMALLFWLALHPAHKLLWIGLTLATLATYHLRPVYLFVALLVPFMGFIVRVLIEPRRARQLKRFTLGLVAASLLPVLAYCGVRWAMVGHFGIVNFSGYNLAGIAASFLDQETVAALPEEYQELGARVLRQRELRGWQTYTRESVTSAYFPQYGKNVWLIAEPFARQIMMRRREAHRAAQGESALAIGPLEARQIEQSDRPPLAGGLARAINDLFEGFSKSVIQRKPRLYAKWVGDSFRYGLDRTSQDGWIRWPMLALAATLPFLLLARHNAQSMARKPATAPGAVAGVYALCLLGLAFFLCKLLLISLFSWPWDRYLFAGELFVPSALSAGLFALWRHLLGAAA